MLQKVCFQLELGPKGQGLWNRECLPSHLPLDGPVTGPQRLRCTASTRQLKRSSTHQPGHEQSLSSVLANVREEIPLSHSCGAISHPVSFE